VIDAKHNLIVADQSGNIHVIYPPYSQVNYPLALKSMYNDVSREGGCDSTLIAERVLI
jgi:hypothetical protein